MFPSRKLSRNRRICDRLGMVTDYGVQGAAIRSACLEFSDFLGYETNERHKD